MKNEIYIYVDVFKEKEGNVSCNVYRRGEVYFLRHKSITDYVEDILILVNTTKCCADDVIKIYVDARGIGYAIYDILKDKYKDTYKLIKSDITKSRIIHAGNLQLRNLSKDEFIDNMQELVKTHIIQ